MTKTRIALNSLLCLAALAHSPALYAQSVLISQEQQDTLSKLNEQVSKLRVQAQADIAERHRSIAVKNLGGDDKRLNNLLESIRADKGGAGKTEVKWACSYVDLELKKYNDPNYVDSKIKKTCEFDLTILEISKRLLVRKGMKPEPALTTEQRQAEELKCYKKGLAKRKSALTSDKGELERYRLKMIVAAAKKGESIEKAELEWAKVYIAEGLKQNEDPFKKTLLKSTIITLDRVMLDIKGAPPHKLISDQEAQAEAEKILAKEKAWLLDQKKLLDSAKSK